MTEESMTIFIGFALFIVVLAFIIWRDKRQQYQWFLLKVKNMWGSIPEREYTAKELDSISHYAKNHQNGRFMIDDITWNDLSMDQIFMIMNGTVSSCGEDILYQMLRMPEFDQEKLTARNNLIEYFRTHEQERIQIQNLVKHVRKMSELSISDYIYALKNVDRASSVKYKIMAGLTVAAIAMIFVAPVPGVFLTIAMLCNNGLVHLRDAKKIEPYLNCVICIIRLLTAADGFAKLKPSKMTNSDMNSVKPDNSLLKPYLERIENGRKEMKNFRRGAYLVASANSMQDGLEAIFISYLKICFHVDLIKFYSMLESVEGHEADIDDMFAAMGELDALIAIASFREALPYYCEPELVSAGQYVSCRMQDIYHPMIANAVPNSIHIQKGVLVTGSNASGKSTFLKTIALNTIFAQTIYTCTARAYHGNFFRVLTSMALRDDLESGESYYIVEIKSLQRILEECKKGEPVLCIVDEVLRGTNTIERIAASSQILRSLIKKNVIPLAATHDIELSYILDGLYENYHFEEEIVENDVLFNYLIKSGRATSRNAIKLLEIIGYDKKIVEDAQAAARDFEVTGRWV